MIIGSMATYPAREGLFWDSVQTIVNQVDRLYIVLNEFTSVPHIPNVPDTVEFILPDQDLKDVGKFRPAFGDDDLVFFVDDDILYPPDYVAHTIAMMAALPQGRAVAGGYHGTRYLPARFKGDLASALGALKHRYYGGKLRKLRRAFFYESALETPQIVDQLGTGVTAMYGRDVPPLAYMEDSRKFVDVRLARWCHERAITQVCLPRTQGWIATQSTDETIYHTFTRRTPKQVRREIYDYAGAWARQTPL